MGILIPTDSRSSVARSPDFPIFVTIRRCFFHDLAQ
jgi:hypothetical protein